MHQDGMLLHEVEQLVVGPLRVHEAQRRVRCAFLPQDIANAQAGLRQQLPQFVLGGRRLEVFHDPRLDAGVTDQREGVAAGPTRRVVEDGDAQPSDQAVELSQSAAPAAATDFTEAEVRKMDKPAGKITLRHGEIRSLEMPPMTMVFAVSDPAVLEQVKPGDKVRFKAVDQGGKLTVTALQAAN